MVFIALALFGARNSSTQGLPFRYTLTYLGIAFVGIGSLAFHATLLYEAQLLDELPMIYTSLVLSYCILEDSRHGDKAKGGLWLPLVESSPAECRLFQAGGTILALDFSEHVSVKISVSLEWISERDS